MKRAVCSGAGLLLPALLLFTSSHCTPSGDMFRADEPRQKGVSNPLSKRGKVDSAQRRRDCWDMPSAQACYETGLDYEMGLNGETNLGEAQRYYDKACALDHDDEHCQAAERLRNKTKP